MRAYRIGTAEFCGSRESAFAGLGGLYGHGRWHQKGSRIVYMASSLPLAMLEILVHLKRNQRVRPHVSWVVEIPDRHVGPTPTLPAQWEQDIAATRAVGTKWLDEHQSVALRVPSVVAAGSDNLLINPEHSAFSLNWIIEGPTPISFDPRLL